MNDYTSEGGEMQVRAFFEKAVNAFVDASRLSKEVADLRASIAQMQEETRNQIQGLVQELSEVSHRNTWLEAELGQSQKEKAELVETLRATTVERDEAKADAAWQV